jgi:hypothetical protein
MEAANERQSAERLAAAVEETLAEAWGGRVSLDREVVLRGSDRSRVLRFRVREGPAAAPASVIIKHVQGDENERYDPDNAPPFTPAWRFFNDWTGAQFLSAVADDPLLCPRFYGGDRGNGFVALEDLGEGDSLAEVLLGDDPARAEQALLALAATLGRMHAATIGREAEYQRLQDALGARSPGNPGQSSSPYNSFREGCGALGIALTPGVAAALEAVAAAMREPGPFLAYTHGDPCPDNNRYADGRLRLFDFEYGAFRHALRDGVYGRVPFPTCWCVNRLPPDVPPRMEAAYRQELVKGCPEARDNDCFHRAVVEASAHWTFDTIGWHLSHALEQDREWGIATTRQRVLVRLDNLAALTGQLGHLEELGETAQEIAARLRALWPSEADAMPLYPAFRGGNGGSGQNGP